MFNLSTGQGFTQLSSEKQFFNRGEAQQVAQRNTVNVYFIGWKLLDEEGNTPTFPVKGRAIKMPPIGDFIQMTNVQFEDLRTRAQIWNHKTGQWIQVVTLDADLAQAVKSAYDNDMLGDDLDTFTSIVRNAAVTQLSDEELEKELERRKAAIQDTGVEDKEETKTTTKTTASKAKAKK